MSGIQQAELKDKQTEKQLDPRMVSMMARMKAMRLVITLDAQWEQGKDALTSYGQDYRMGLLTAGMQALCSVVGFEKVCHLAIPHLPPKVTTLLHAVSTGFRRLRFQQENNYREILFRTHRNCNIAKRSTPSTHLHTSKINRNRCAFHCQQRPNDIERD